jgi:hypothetical protein
MIRSGRTFTRTMTLRPPGLVTRLWYRWYCRMQPPRSECVSREIEWLVWARWVPMRFEGFHRAYAARHGLCWLPCPLCMREYGGHQHAGGIPDPMHQPTGPLSPLYYVGICPSCTRSRKGD